MTEPLKIIGQTAYETSCGDTLVLSSFNDGSMSGFLRPVTGECVYMTHSMLKMLKLALVKLNETAI